MALTITPRVTDTTLKGATLVAATVAFDSSYPTGGEAIAAADLGLDAAIDFAVVTTGGADVVVWDRATGKLKIFTADGTEATNASDQSAVSRDILFLGR